LNYKKENLVVFSVLKDPVLRELEITKASETAISEAISSKILCGILELTKQC